MGYRTFKPEIRGYRTYSWRYKPPDWVGYGMFRPKINGIQIRGGGGGGESKSAVIPAYFTVFGVVSNQDRCDSCISLTCGLLMCLGVVL